MISARDNYDSFTYNLGSISASWVANVAVIATTKSPWKRSSCETRAASVFLPVLATPQEAGISVELFRAPRRKFPILVCLSAISHCAAFGGKLVRGFQTPFSHGKTSMIHHDGKYSSASCGSLHRPRAIHSLIVDKNPAA